MDISIHQKREYIVFTAIDLIHENGIHNVSTKEIARRLGISEGSVFKSYPKKDDLLMAVLERFSMYDDDMYRTASDRNTNPIEAIYFFINQYLAYCENYPAITSLFQVNDALKGHPELDNKLNEIHSRRQESMKRFITKAQEVALIDVSSDPDLIVDIINSIIKGMIAKWRVMNYQFSVQKRTYDAIKLLLESLQKIN